MQAGAPKAKFPSAYDRSICPFGQTGISVKGSRQVCVTLPVQASGVRFQIHFTRKGAFMAFFLSVSLITDVLVLLTSGGVGSK